MIDKVSSIESHRAGSILKILVEKKHSVLSQLYLRLESGGHKVLKHKISDGPEEGIEMITLRLSDSRPITNEVIQLIYEIPSCIDVIDNQGNLRSSGDTGSTNQKEAAEHKRTTIEGLAKKVVSVYPKVSIMLDRLPSKSEDERNQLLTLLGISSGELIHKEKHQFGFPMKLEPYIKRVIVPTLKPIANLKHSDNQIILTDNICCSVKAGMSNCDFVLGLIQGLINANTKTSHLTVNKDRCVSRLDTDCLFAIF